MGDEDHHANIHNLFQSVRTDPYEFLQIVYNPTHDTLTRRMHFPCSTNPQNDNPTLPFSAKDVPLNPNHKTWLRLYKPTATPPPLHKLPLIIYFHGGGFIMCSASDSMCHDLCARLAFELPAVVVSVEYRLAPENRLPAAYEDAAEAIGWVREQAMDEEKGEEWLRQLADFSNCYLMGISAGGNIAYHAALRALPLDLKPVRIVGLILNQAYFGGVERSGSEMRLINGRVFPISVSDLMWELSLPRGVDRDHEYCNPTVGGEGRWEKIGWGGRCFVSGHGGDPLVDRQLAVARMMERAGVKVKVWYELEGDHGAELFDPAKTSALMVQLKLFISSSKVA
ncbi:hypothetical protein Syun_024077 [Stephania yunnanensis]|uniref:Alpha/beta hydrolase fold-3 domain-containing protein n=1 Tax=Stephania yunnanensis TaxID=152371 RepID=A0AAP0FA67_9MAGN